MNSLITELKRRNVFRVAMVYAVAGWLLMQLGVVLETSLNLPPWFDTFITVVVLLGFPIALILAWVFEMTPDGIKRTIEALNSEGIAQNPRKMLNVILVLLGLLAIIFGIIGWKTLIPTKSDPRSHLEAQNGVAAHSIKPVNIKQSIAVLPFEDFSQDKTQDYFARGISEELLNLLARSKDLRVASRTSAFAFKDEGKSISEIADRLDVAHILEGSIRKSGDTLRITAQLIDTSTDEHLWSETYDRPLTVENLFQIQDEIAASIVKELKGQLRIIPPEAAGRTLSLEAYELYLKARENHKVGRPETLKAAEEEFKGVIKLDPKFAPAYSGLADTYLSMRYYTIMKSKDAVKFAEPNVRRALELDPSSAEALTSAAFLAFIEGSNIQSAIDYTNRAIEANPSYAPAYFRQGQSYSIIGQSVPALAAYKKSLVLNPASLSLQINIQRQQSRLGDYEGARATAESIIRNHPNESSGYLAMGNMFNLTGNYEAAHRYWKEAQARSPEMKSINEKLAEIYCMIGRFDLAHANALKQRSSAFAFLANGEEEKAREHIANMRRSGWISYFYFLLNDTERAYQFAEKLQIPTDVSDARSFRLNASLLAMKAQIYLDKGHPDAAPMIKSLETFFEGKKPEDYNILLDLAAGFRLQIAKGDVKSALEWIDRLHELGINYQQLEFELYKDLRSDPEFTDRITRDRELRADLRKVIEDQLNNAPENWIKMINSAKDDQ